LLYNEKVLDARRYGGSSFLVLFVSLSVAIAKFDELFFRRVERLDQRSGALGSSGEFVECQRRIRGVKPIEAIVRQRLAY
jgi:hypothetical protein